MNPGMLLMLASLGAAIPAATAYAQQNSAGVDTSQWECKLCPYPKGIGGNVDAGVLSVDKDSFQFGRYTGLEKGTYPNLDASARYSEGASYFDLRASDLGLPHRSLELAQGVQGEGKVRLSYAELPFQVSDSAMTPFAGVGTPSLSLPAAWVRGVSTQTMPNLAGSLQSVRIESTRRRIGFEWATNPEPNWELGASVKQENREGTKRTAGSFFLNSVHLVAPVDYSTDQIETYASYAASRWHVRVAYLASVFHDSNTALRWENPFAEVLPGATVGQLALPPDNQFHQLSFTGGYHFDERTHASASLSLGRMEQDQQFLPATINPTIAAVALPRDSLQGRVDTTRADVKLVSTLSDQWGLNLAYSYDDRDNRTPQATFDWVVTDLPTAATPRTNLPYSYTRNLLKGSADYRITLRDKASAGLDRDGRERTFQEVSKTTEDTAWVKYAFRRDLFEGSVKYARAHRDGSSYSPVPEIITPENPVLRKYNMADRDRNLLGARVTATPVETLTIGLDLSRTTDDYTKSPVGLTSGRQYNVGVDLTARVDEDTSVHLYLSREEIRSQQSGAQSFTNPPDWSAENIDTVKTAGAGLKHALIADTLDIGLDLTRSRSVGETKVVVTSADPSFPNIESDLDVYKLYALYKMKPDLTLRVSLWQERYASRNWAIDGVAPSTIPNVLAFGETSPDHKVRAVALTAGYRF